MVPLTINGRFAQEIVQEGVQFYKWYLKNFQIEKLTTSIISIQRLVYELIYHIIPSK